MCSNYENEELPEKLDKLSIGRTCMKCKTQTANVVIRVNDPFCRACFLTYTTHKFRSAFGKSKLIRDGESVLVAYSGGPASTALLHLIQEGKSPRAQKKLRFIPTILWIDESEAYSRLSEPDTVNKDQIEEYLSSCDFKYITAQLHEAVDNVEELRDNLMCMKSLTDKEQYIHILKSKLMRSIAISAGINKVITGETATRLAASLLSRTAEGRGAHISYTTGISDTRDEETMIIRPMREFTSKEVTLYNIFNKLTSLSHTALTTKTKVSSSIDRLTESFIVGLQNDFPSTVNTVMRTGDKLMAQPVTKENLTSGGNTNCRLCKAPLDSTSSDAASAMASLRWSEALAEKRRRQMLGSNEAVATDSDNSSADGTMCYGCTQIMKCTNT